MLILGETMQQRRNNFFQQCLLALTGALMSGAALAVGDMPGGPNVLQTNLRPGVTKIAADQYWIHNFLLVVCLVIFVAVFAVRGICVPGDASV